MSQRENRSKSIADTMKTMKKLLEEIFGKLSILTSKYDNVTMAFRDMQEETRQYRKKVDMLLANKIKPQQMRTSPKFQKLTLQKCSKNGAK